MIDAQNYNVDDKLKDGTAVTIRAKTLLPVLYWAEPEASLLSTTTSPRFSAVPSMVTAQRTKAEMSPAKSTAGSIFSKLSLTDVCPLS